jgi:hypothetical protein
MVQAVAMRRRPLLGCVCPGCSWSPMTVVGVKLVATRSVRFSGAMHIGVCISLDDAFIRFGQVLVFHSPASSMRYGWVVRRHMPF